MNFILKIVIALIVGWLVMWLIGLLFGSGTLATILGILAGLAYLLYGPDDFVHR